MIKNHIILRKWFIKFTINKNKLNLQTSPKYILNFKFKYNIILIRWKLKL